MVLGVCLPYSPFGPTLFSVVLTHTKSCWSHASDIRTLWPVDGQTLTPVLLLKLHVCVQKIPPPSLWLLLDAKWFRHDQSLYIGDWPAFTFSNHKTVRLAMMLKLAFGNPWKMQGRDIENIIFSRKVYFFCFWLKLERGKLLCCFLYWRSPKSALLLCNLEEHRIS